MTLRRSKSWNGRESCFLYESTHIYIYISCYYTYNSNVIIVWVRINRTYNISYIQYNIMYTKIRFVMKSQKSWNEILPQTRGVYASNIRRYLHDVLVLIFILRERFIGLPNAQLLYDIMTSPSHCNRLYTIWICYDNIILFCFFKSLVKWIIICEFVATIMLVVYRIYLLSRTFYEVFIFYLRYLLNSNIYNLLLSYLVTIMLW